MFWNGICPWHDTESFLVGEDNNVTKTVHVRKQKIEPNK